MLEQTQAHRAASRLTLVSNMEIRNRVCAELGAKDGEEDEDIHEDIGNLPSNQPMDT